MNVWGANVLHIQREEVKFESEYEWGEGQPNERMSGGGYEKSDALDQVPVPFLDLGHYDVARGALCGVWGANDDEESDHRRQSSPRALSGKRVAGLRGWQG